MSAKLFLIMQAFSLGETLLKKMGTDSDRTIAIEKLKKSIERLEKSRGR